MAAHFPPWAIAAIVAATVVLAVATTLITLALEQAHRARREAAANPEPQASVRTPFITPARQAEIVSSHPARDRSH